jgi:hypothetical protein
MKIKISIPDSLNEITLDQFQRFDKLTKENEPSEFVNQKTIEIFCNIELKEIAKISYQSSKEILEHLNGLFEKKHKFVKPNERPLELFGVKYGFEPNIEEISTGAYIDAENYLTDVQTLHKAMAVLYRPIIAKTKDLYTIEPYESALKYEGIMKSAPLDVVFGMQVFFWDLGIELLTAMSRYTVDKLSEDEKKALGKNMDGINQSMQLLREICSDLTKSQDYRFISS